MAQHSDYNIANQGFPAFRSDLNNVLSASLKVGDVIYEHGVIIITSTGIPGTTGYGFVNYGTAIYDSFSHLVEVELYTNA